MIISAEEFINLINSNIEAENSMKTTCSAKLIASGSWASIHR